ncbi:MAG: sugar ABC transporter permease [Chloroflexi bacterium]|nr:sugar ABC transporter permease [Chloroflexota bacterium]
MRNVGELARAPILALPRLTLRQREAILGFVFVAPLLIGFAIFVGGPLLAILYFSFFRWNIIQGTLTFIGTANYERLLTSSDVAEIARTTFLFGVGFVPLTVVAGLVLAVALNSRTRLFIGLRAAYFLPVVISLAAWSIVWRLVLAPDGPLNALLQLVGQSPVAWLRNPALALAAIIGVQFLKTAGYSMVLFLAALQTVPSDLLEAAKVDGATRWQSFRAITLPLIAPFTLMVTILLTIASFKTFALIQLMTKGGPGQATTVLAYYIYQTGLQLFDMGYASAVAVVLFVAVLTLTVLQLAARRWWVFEGEGI